MASKILDALWRKQSGCCAYCRRPTNRGGGQHDWLAATVDHVIPRAGYGPNEAWNRVMACRGCNSAKGSMDVTAFRALLALHGGVPPLTKAQIAVQKRASRRRSRLRLNEMPGVEGGWKRKLPAPAWQADLAQYPGGRWHADGAPHGE